LAACVAEEAPESAPATFDVAPATFTIGVLADPPEEVIGEIADLTVDRSGRIYLLDSHYARVSIFDPDGALSAQGGRPGDGPGEFKPVGLTSIAVDTFGVMHVLDAGNLRIIRLRRNEAGLVTESSLRLESPASDLCLLRGRTFVLANPLLVSEGNLVHEISSDGEVSQSFAPRVHPEGELAVTMAGRTDYLNYGSIVCDGATGFVIVAHRDFPYVRGFSMDGRERWTVSLRGFEPALIERISSGPGAGRCCRVRPPASGRSHTTMSAVSDGAGRLILSVAEYRPGGTPVLSYEARVLDSRTGEELEARRIDGEVLAVRDRRVFVVLRNPFPHITARNF
jgi:hypothetical protein